MRFIQFRSAPAQKDGPEPASTTMRTASSASMVRSASVSSTMSVSSKALWRSGRLSVTRPIGPWRSMASAVDTGSGTGGGEGLHPEDTEPRVFQRGVAGGSERQPEDAAGVGGVDHAIVPEARGGVVRMALALVLLADGRLE